MKFLSWKITQQAMKIGWSTLVLKIFWRNINLWNIFPWMLPQNIKIQVRVTKYVVGENKNINKNLKFNKKKVWILNFFRSIYDTTWALCLPVSTDPVPQPAAINSTQTLNFAQPCHFLWLKYKIFSYFHALKYFLGKSNWL